MAFDQTAHVSIRSMASFGAFRQGLLRFGRFRRGASPHEFLQGRHGILTSQVTKCLYGGKFGRLILPRQLQESGGFFHRVTHPLVWLFGCRLLEPGNRHQLSRSAEICRGGATSIGLRAFQLCSVLEQIHNRLDRLPDTAVGIGANLLQARNETAVALFGDSTKGRFANGFLLTGDVCEGLFKRRER